MFELLKGALTIAIEDLKHSIKRKTIVAYIFFAVAFGISLYATYMQPYGAPQGELSRLPLGIKLEQGTSPMIDLAIFMLSFTASALQSAGVGSPSEIVLPVDIGITLFVIAPVLIGITSVSKLAVRLCASTIVREREARTSYHLALSPQPRVLIYLSKFAGSAIALIPMIFIIFMGSSLVIETSFIPHIEITEATILKSQVLIASVVTAFLFASLSMFISTVSRNEERAVNRGGWILRIMSSLATIWIFLPIFHIAGQETASMIENITKVSPITLDMIALYSGNMFSTYMLAQVGVAILFLLMGMTIFMRQDIEY